MENLKGMGSLKEKVNLKDTESPKAVESPKEKAARIEARDTGDVTIERTDGL